MTFEQLHNSYLEQDEPKIFGVDWKGSEIYEGDEFYEIDGEYVIVDELDEYAHERFERRIAGE
nr:MAG TPA: protein of unknown function (DUF2175) [Caudoviricetes sp.]DAT25526.1 MAG TPA: protein of unknown function (DUF2175) [Caudoviricetes sp.]